MAKKADGAAELERRLAAFEAEHPQGWHHGDWLALLDDLRSVGVDVSDEGALGRRLERVHLEATLARLGVRNLGPRRRSAVAEHFGTLWALRRAGAEEIAAVPGLTPALARSLREALDR
jgi:hypothetical protein